MKTDNRFKSFLFSALACATLTLTGPSAFAQTILTNSYTNSFDDGGNTAPFSGTGSVASWIGWYGLKFNNTPLTNDTTMDAQGNTNTSGSLRVDLPFGTNGDQGVFFGTFNNTGAYNGSTTVSMNTVKSLSFDLHFTNNVAPNAAGNFGTITMALIDPKWSGGDFGDFSPITIPASATNGWVHLTDTNITADVAKCLAAIPAFTNAAGIGFEYQSYSGYPQVPVTFWIDNVAVGIGPAPVPTYPNLTNATLQFNDPSSVMAIYGADNAVTGNTTSWYGETNYVDWSTNDSHGNTNSGSLYVSAQFMSGNNALVLAIPFDTNESAFAVDPNYINANQYTGIEMDVLWDTNNSTVGIDTFNSQGDINGFPIGVLDNNASGAGSWIQDEICGSSTTFIPDAASNSWQHIYCPFGKLQPNDQQMIGLWIKKYVGATGINGTVAFWVDNITFDGAPIPTHPNQATASLTKPVLGLQCDFTGNAGNASYDREQICTQNSGYSSVNASGPVTYSITFGEAPAANSSGLIVFDENGTASEPDWVDPSVLRIQISPNGSVTLQCKTNTANGNGDLYDGSDPAWNGTDASHTNTPPVVGTWTFTISNNTNFLCVAPNGATTNLPFPLGFQSADVVNNFPPGTMYVYFGAMGGGAASEGDRWVVQKCSISGGGVTPLNEDFVAEANTGSSANGGAAGPAGSGGNAIAGQHLPWTSPVSNVAWTDTSDSSTPYGLYLIGTNTLFHLDWTAIAGAGLTVLTNSTVSHTGWGTNSTLTSAAWLDATFFESDVDITNAPASGDLFFELVNP